MPREPEVVFDDDNPEWTEQDFKDARPAHEMLSPDVIAAFRNSSPAPSDESAKVQITLRLDRDIVERFRATGGNWQSLINEALKKAV